MMRDVKDKSSAQYRRMTWDVLSKSINGLVNKVNASNNKNILPELFVENLIRGRGLFARSYKWLLQPLLMFLLPWLLS
jgi:pre-mRNA-splicing factor CWC22